ncbi:hypothetical protein DCC85_05245 [Paenibacillus sp. CAA11]|uniref:hypothetical protein n=1 Tax=Paenibacillus sp. CAA11 TaxID=1532905 RepID=UPI000D3CE176|nr:hypothetical protein [Paenibacillus sp. CAA11]AWB43681.1 hypothetical protein DCC85_05245 [Paenibacillus sp. CAA11]
MAIQTVTYETLKIAPFEMTLLELKLEKKIQDHARLRFTGIIAEEMEEQYVKMASEQLPIHMYYTDADGKVHTLFHGMILKLHVRVDRDAYWLEAEAISHTYAMDIKPQFRAYQNAAMPIPSVMKHICDTYSRANLIDTYTEHKTLGGFTLQYQETDWAFLKRLASHYHAPLVPSVIQDRISVYMGMPEHQEIGEIQATHYRVYKDILALKKIAENEKAPLVEQDFICYELVTNQVMELGDRVTFKGKKLHVCEILTEMHRSVLTHTYTLRSKKATYQKKVYNSHIVGASIQGKVKDVVRDEVKVQLEYDQDWSLKTAHLFPYSTMYASEDQTGWYCMPEKGDDVRIYFPGFKESEGIALSTVRKKLPAEAMEETSAANNGSGGQKTVVTNTRTVTNTVVKTEQLQPVVHYDKDLKKDLMANPDTKFILTPHGQQIKFEKDRISIIGAGGGAWITLFNDGSMILNSSNKVSIQTGKQIEMTAKTILFMANQIDMSTKEGEAGIKIDQGQINIKGVEILVNE